MEPQGAIQLSVKEVKTALDDLQFIVSNETCSHDSLNKLRNALSDINEEVNLLTNVMQMNMTSK